MRDWIWNRIHALRNADVIDFSDFYDLGKFDNDSLDIQKEFYANDEKNMESSPLKQTAQRLKKEQ